MRRRPPSTRLARAAMGAVVSAVLLLGAELGLRRAGVTPGYQADQIGGWRALPEQHNGRVPTREGGGFRMSTNADGLRTALPRARAAGRPRLAVLGDSIAFGWGVSDGDTLADGAARGLAGQGQPAVEVLNAAQPGFSSVQAARLFDAVVAEYQPDLTVLFLPMHDHNLALISDAEHLGGAAGPLSALRVQLATRSSLYEALRRALFPLADRPFLVRGEGQGGPRVPRVDDDERAAAVGAMRARAAAWGGEIALGHLPFAEDQETGAAAQRLGLEWAADYAAENNVQIVDLRDCCLSLGVEALLPDDPGHLSAAGNAAAGNALAAQVAAAPALSRP